MYHTEHTVLTLSKLQVTSRLDASERDWKKWNWKSKGDFFGNGAFFTQSGTQPALVPSYTYTALPAANVPAATAKAGPLTNLPSAKK